MTIKDLAAQTGYSVGTVSRVLNNQPHVSNLAREIILQAVAESGFQLNANAKQLKQQHSNSILVICKGNFNELFDALLVALQARAAQINYPLIVDYIDELGNEVHRAIQLCLEKKPLGILFLGGNQENFRQDFHQICVPCVLVTNSAAQLSFPNLSSVASGDEAAAGMAIDHLVELGHRDFVVIGGNRHNSDTTRLRYQGCMKALEGHGLPFQEAQYETSRFSYEDGYRAARALLTRNPNATALFAMSDVMAIGAVRALKDMGKRVPEDVSVVGFDGLTIGEYMVPRLSTVAQPLEVLADRSLELLTSAIKDGKGSCHETVPVRMIQRESASRICRK